MFVKSSIRLWLFLFGLYIKVWLVVQYDKHNLNLISIINMIERIIWGIFNLRDTAVTQ